MAHPLDKGKTRFRQFVVKSKEATPRLPLVHSTDTYTLAEIARTNKISPQDCTVFGGEKISYFFYGRPAFKPNASTEPTSLAQFLPVCLILKPDFVKTYSRIYPFDSGAFINGFYKNFLHRDMTLGDFQLLPSLSSPGQIITTFFTAVPNYLLARPDTFTPPADQFEASTYVALASDKATNSLDNRNSAIEIQIHNQITINDALAAVIVPSPISKSALGNTLRSKNIEVIPYHMINRMMPSDYMSQIHAICLNYYISIGIINKDDL